MYSKKWLGVLKMLLFFCLCIPLLTSCESRKTIVNGLTEKEANEIVVYLSNKGVDATKVPSIEAGGGGSKIQLYDVSIKAEQATDAMSLLNQAGLPRKRGQDLLSIFSGAGLVPSEMEQKIRYQAGLAEQIASTIRKFDGVLDAEVQISFPEEDPLNPGKTKGDITSSVYVKHNGVLDDPNALLVTKIKRLVASSITGLKYDNVTVIPDRARFAESPIGIQATREEGKKYASVWTIIIATESLTRFRILFFSFTTVTLLLVISLVWVLWKVVPLLKGRGGMKSLFSWKSLEEGEAAKGESEEEAGEAKEEKKPEEEDKSSTDVT